MRYSRRNGRQLRLEALEHRWCLSASVGWDGTGLGYAELANDADEVSDQIALLALSNATTAIDSTTLSLHKTEQTDGDLITVAGIVGSPSDSERFTVLVFWGDGSDYETFVVVPGTSTFSLSRLYGTDSTNPTDSTYRLYYSTMEEDGETYLVASVVRYDMTIEDLGTVDYKVVEDLTLADDSEYYEFETARDGVLTLETLVANAGDDVRIELYSQNPIVNSGLTPVAVSTGNDGGQRLDTSVTGGQTYYVKIEGTGTDFDLRITNLVQQDGAKVTFFGTEGDDTFEFNAADGLEATINGVLYELDEADAETIDFDGGDGYDVVRLHDSSGNEALEAWATEAVLRNDSSDGIDNFTVNVSSFEEMHVYARSGGMDTAILHDSEGNDKFKAEPGEGYAKMYGSSMYNRVKFFDVVEAYSSGGNDMARIFDTSGDDTFGGQKDKSTLRGEGYEVAVHEFAQVVAYASEGTDTALFVDSSLRDEFHAKPTKAELFDAASDGEVYQITVRRFDSVSAEATNTEGTNEDGGQDIAKIWPTASDDYFEASDDWFRFYVQDGAPELLYEVVGFETVRVRETTEKDDAADVVDPLVYDLILEDGWE
jgi:hypothetical protein